MVFYAERPDNPTGKVWNLMLLRTGVSNRAFGPALLKGVEIIAGKSVTISKNPDGTMAKENNPSKPFPILPGSIGDGSQRSNEVNFRESKAFQHDCLLCGIVKVSAFIRIF
jgi:hypothetical protein